MGDEDEETEAQKDSEIESQIEPVGAQIESVGAQSEPVEAQKQTSTDEAQKVEEEPQQIQQTSFINFGDLPDISDNSTNNSEKTQKKNLVKSKEDTKKETKGIDYAQTVLNLQEKLSRKSHCSVVQTTQEEVNSSLSTSSNSPKILVKSQEDSNDSTESFR